ncbi:acetolactate synthase small subunit [Anaerofustis stercorihominis]|uniref:Acetolactate synthase small subunit n=2 Tax=Anaerofustis stercorihominis TaxID=214853 RepID=B1CAQ5_9FIRM|nr:acetolactate synthase small subunit [Anaerofustis stercorihominis]EDS71352.1 acetolactate synthase, small subunit [Anaerofustis stercorihominis DSM 17244]MCQ4794749.1 acetolactate synthase small subunit [Anaerofustis stercorihominis]MCR2033370.1 acetolactate synthase small subunit [Anaerofustis stercorihominis]RGD73897.1 acetolactate synthase small subunit [Anaerofustis stercorihominis]
MAYRKEVISILVDNQSNVLTRIVSLFGRRGFNIDSLTVSTTNDKDISRITIVFNGTDQSLYQIMTQTKKLEVVKDIFTLDSSNSLYRELLLVKIKTDKTERTSLKEIVDIYRGKIIDLCKDSMIIELTGAPEKLDGFMNMIDCYDVVEVCRTGITGIARGLEPVR